MTVKRWLPVSWLTRLAALWVLCFAGTAAAQGFPYEPYDSHRNPLGTLPWPPCVVVDCGWTGSAVFGIGPEIRKVPELGEQLPELNERTVELQLDLIRRLEERHVGTLFELNAAIAEQDPARVNEALGGVYQALAYELESFSEGDFEGAAEAGLVVCGDETCLENFPPYLWPYIRVVQDLDLSGLLVERLPWFSPRHFPRVWPPCIVIDCGWTGAMQFGRGPYMERLPELMEHLPELDEATLNVQATLFAAMEERHQEELLFFREAVISRDEAAIVEALRQLDAALISELENVPEEDFSNVAQGGAFLCWDDCEGIPPWILPYVLQARDLNLDVAQLAQRLAH
jgi:hypothetical protein